MLFFKNQSNCKMLKITWVILLNWQKKLKTGLGHKFRLCIKFHHLIKHCPTQPPKNHIKFTNL